MNAKPDTSNLFEVLPTPDGGVFIRKPPASNEALTRSLALNLAAWLVATADAKASSCRQFLWMLEMIGAGAATERLRLDVATQAYWLGREAGDLFRSKHTGARELLKANFQQAEKLGVFIDPKLLHENQS